MYYVHCEYNSDNGGHDIESFESIEDAMGYIQKYMFDNEIDTGDATEYFTVIKGEELLLRVKDVTKTVTVQEVTIEEIEE